MDFLRLVKLQPRLDLILSYLENVEDDGNILSPSLLAIVMLPCVLFVHV